LLKNTHTDYQKLQYFFSDSRWDIQALKRKRLEIIQKQKTTASTKDGLFVIDDTRRPKPFAKKLDAQNDNSAKLSSGQKHLYVPSRKGGVAINVLCAQIKCQGVKISLFIRNVTFELRILCGRYEQLIGKKILLKITIHTVNVGYNLLMYW